MKILEIPKPEIVGHFDAEAAQKLLEEIKSVSPNMYYPNEDFAKTLKAIGLGSFLYQQDPYAELRFEVNETEDTELESVTRWHFDTGNNFSDFSEVIIGASKNPTLVAFGSLVIKDTCEFKRRIVSEEIENEEWLHELVVSQLKHGNLAEFTKHKSGDVIKLAPFTPHRRSPNAGNRLFYKSVCQPHVFDGRALRKATTEFLEQYGYQE